MSIGSELKNVLGIVLGILIPGTSKSTTNLTTTIQNEIAKVYGEAATAWPKNRRSTRPACPADNFFAILEALVATAEKDRCKGDLKVLGDVAVDIAQAAYRAAEPNFVSDIVALASALKGNSVVTVGGRVGRADRAGSCRHDRRKGRLMHSACVVSVDWLSSAGAQAVLRLLADLPTGQDNVFYMEPMDMEGIAIERPLANQPTGASVDPEAMNLGDAIRFDTQDGPFRTRVDWKVRRIRQRGSNFDLLDPERHGNAEHPSRHEGKGRLSPRGRPLPS